MEMEVDEEVNDLPRCCNNRQEFSAEHRVRYFSQSTVWCLYWQIVQFDSFVQAVKFDKYR